MLLQKAYKHGSREIITEFCAGMIDEGETPIQAAKRELSEETGYASSQWEKIGEVFANPTGSEMKYHFFLAGNCNQMKSPQQDEAEQIETFLVKSFEKARELLTNPKTITSSATMAALVFAEGSVRKKKIGQVFILP
ncbi:NUDIX hydrolase [Candidatus Gracilibacteria bacterium]|nr:NUDIX hydrolase [Candidatus Gracilibacteria bacterium]